MPSIDDLIAQRDSIVTLQLAGVPNMAGGACAGGKVGHARSALNIFVGIDVQMRRKISSFHGF